MGCCKELPQNLKKVIQSLNEVLAMVAFNHA
jgi:hypothetical protein